MEVLRTKSDKRNFQVEVLLVYLFRVSEQPRVHHCTRLNAWISFSNSDGNHPSERVTRNNQALKIDFNVAWILWRDLFCKAPGIVEQLINESDSLINPLVDLNLPEFIIVSFVLILKI